MSFDLESVVRENIRRLKPYSSARSEFAGSAEVFLDANENAFGSPAGYGYNRYPDPLQKELKERLLEIRSVDPSKIFVGNGSDEAIDLLFRIFCEPGRDQCIVCPPTYGMYQVSADINDVTVNEVPLTPEFQLDVSAVLSAITPRTRLIFICSPNNPTGNLMRREDVKRIAEEFNGIVVVDEAYIDFAAAESVITELPNFPNLVVLQTFSKAWAMAGLRVGLAFASAEIISLMNRVKPPYNVSGIAQRAVVDALERQGDVAVWVSKTIEERSRLVDSLSRFDFVRGIYPSDANFLLVRMNDARMLYEFLVTEKIIVRDRSNVQFCAGCLRITVGNVEENDRLVAALERFNNG
jgi:histidinol-phosphate aminotransferase